MLKINYRGIDGRKYKPKEFSYEKELKEFMIGLKGNAIVEDISEQQWVSLKATKVLLLMRQAKLYTPTPN